MSNSDPNEEPHQTHDLLVVHVLCVVLRNVRLVALVAGLITIIGALGAYLPESQYTSTSKVIRGVQADGPVSYLGGISLLRGFGVNLGIKSIGLGPEAYPAILTSRAVGQAVVRDTFYFNRLGHSTTYVDYLREIRCPTPLMRYTIQLPSTIISLIQKEDEADKTSLQQEMLAIEEVLSHISATIDPENGLMSVAVVNTDPSLAATLNARFLEKLVLRLEEIRMIKAQKNLAFIEERLNEAAGELRKAEDTLAYFNDHHIRLNSAQGRTQRERLQRRLTFKTNLYNDLQAQLIQAEIDLGRSISVPMITILDPPVVPGAPSGPPRGLLFGMSIAMGLLLGYLVACIKEGMVEKLVTQSKAEKT